MIAMVIFFLLSIYLSNHFEYKIHSAKEDENFGEADYKKLFEFKSKSTKKKKDTVKKEKEHKSKFSNPFSSKDAQGTADTEVRERTEIKNLDEL